MLRLALQPQHVQQLVQHLGEGRGGDGEDVIGTGQASGSPFEGQSSLHACEQWLQRVLAAPDASASPPACALCCTGWDPTAAGRTCSREFRISIRSFISR